MEPEDLPWPGELEEEEEEEEEEERAEESANQEGDKVVVVEEVEEEEGRELDSDFNYESQPRENTDDEDDEEAKAWLQAHPGRSLLPSSLPRRCFPEDELTGPEKGPSRVLGPHPVQVVVAYAKFPILAGKDLSCSPLSVGPGLFE
ncbi:Alstrom syndrome protein 1-like [Suricata suricatta]|uniref:Alstrom syndrome protein 1-like n=1 Tax=Suricata suricatta TaxID=37032 RepID=UPI001155AD13|nr:Alstrom syndrome protein 1-like [Suricata suricatta]